MSAPPYMKLYIADYHVETTELDVIGHGAYLLLLMAMWRAGGKLPRDEGKLSRLAKCTPEQWAAVRDDVMSHFKVSGGSIRHARVTKEIAKYNAVVDGATQAGKASAAKKASKNKSATPTDVETNVERQTNQPEPEPEPTSEGKPSALDDPNATAWKLAREILTERGGATPVAAGKFFGGLLSRHQLQASELLTSLAGAQVNGTHDPQAYLTKAAQGVFRRRAEIALQQESGNERPRAPTTRQAAYVDRLQDIDRAMELAFEPGPGGGRDRDDYP